VFMRRKLDQVVRSQRAMLDRIAPEIVQEDQAARRALGDHLVEIDHWLETAGHVKVLGVSYERIVAEPIPQIDRVITFLGLALDANEMLRAIEPGLQRQR
jgi:hypothetical protein